MGSNTGDEVAMSDDCLSNVNEPINNKAALSVDVNRLTSITTKTHRNLYVD